ncbi:unnamed protein product, partial [Acidithrix sp. C25]
VGLVTAVGLAEIGHSVTVVDIDPKKVMSVQEGRVPFYEPGLSEMLFRNLQQGRFRITSDSSEALNGNALIFIAVGTPQYDDGSPNLDYVFGVAEQIGNLIADASTIVVKSTVPVGTCDVVYSKINEAIRKRGLEFECDVVSNPEFLKEGSALEDFMKPDRIVVGSDSPSALVKMHELYEPFQRREPVLMEMQTRSSELTKYAANAMLATRISFMNEIAHLADAIGADIEDIRMGIGSDPRIGSSFLYAGAGYGGSCFPKDVKALIHSFDRVGLDPMLLRSVDTVNNLQKELLFELVSDYFDGSLLGKTIAIWGLAFKPDTDDMRESVSIPLIQSLVNGGARVKAYDPVAMENARTIFCDATNLEMVDAMYTAVEGADALILVTEWKQFRAPDFELISKLMVSPVVFDGRNQWNPAKLASLGFTYRGIGRGSNTLS